MQVGHVCDPVSSAPDPALPWGPAAPTSAACRRLEVAAQPLSRCRELQTPREPALRADWQLTGEKWAAGSR